MIRALILVFLASATPAMAARKADCTALLARSGAEAAKVSVTGGACVFTDVRIVDGPTRWRADRVILSGDVDAVPDALPEGLTGGVTGFTTDPPLPGTPPLALTFDFATRGDTLRLNALTLRAGETGGLTAQGRFAGLPQVWPPDPSALVAARATELVIAIEFDGLFEALVPLASAAGLIDPRLPASPQIAKIADEARGWLRSLAGTSVSESGLQGAAFLDTLPRPRGELRLRLGGRGLMLAQLGALAEGVASPDFVARLAVAADAELTWEPDAP